MASASMQEAQVPTGIAPTSLRARQQMQQYLLSLPAASQAQSSAPDTASIAKQSALLTNKVDALHASLTASSRHSMTSEEESSQWSSMVTQLTDLKRLLSRIQSVPVSSRSKSLDDCRDTTQQNIGILQTLMDLVSSSSSSQAAPSVFTAPIAPLSPSPESATRSAASTRSQSWDFAQWKERALQGLGNVDGDDSEDETDDEAGFNRQDDADDGQASEAESVLTDPEDHAPAGSLPSKPLGALRRETENEKQRVPLEDSDFDEYGPPAPSTAAATPSNAVSSTSGSASDTILQGDRSTQEALSGELLRMASILKSNSLAFADALERDRVLLEKAGEDLGQNLDLMTKTRGRLGVYSKKVRSMGWFTLGAIAVVIFSWMFMFIVIRLT